MFLQSRAKMAKRRKKTQLGFIRFEKIFTLYAESKFFQNKKSQKYPYALYMNDP